MNPARFGLQAHFDAAHHLIGGGLCERPHGHTYLVEAVWRDPGQGRLEAGRRHLSEAVDALDHLDLNGVMEFPSCENLCARLTAELEGRLPGLVRVTVQEGLAGWAQLEGSTT